MIYVTATLLQLANEPTVIVKARRKSIARALNLAQIIAKRMDNMRCEIGNVKIGSQTIQSDDGKGRNVSTIEVQISR